MNNTDAQNFEQPQTDVTTGRTRGLSAPRRWLLALGLGLSLGSLACIGDPDAVELNDVGDQQAEDFDTRLSATKVSRPGVPGAACEVTRGPHTGKGTLDEEGFACCWTERERWGSLKLVTRCVECVANSPSISCNSSPASTRGDLTNTIPSNAGALNLAR